MFERGVPVAVRNMQQVTEQVKKACADGTYRGMAAVVVDAHGAMVVCHGPQHAQEIEILELAIQTMQARQGEIEKAVVRQHESQEN